MHNRANVFLFGNESGLCSFVIHLLKNGSKQQSKSRNDKLSHALCFVRTTKQQSSVWLTSPTTPSQHDLTNNSSPHNNNRPSTIRYINATTPRWAFSLWTSSTVKEATRNWRRVMANLGPNKAKAKETLPMASPSCPTIPRSPQRKVSANEFDPPNSWWINNHNESMEVSDITSRAHCQGISDFCGPTRLAYRREQRVNLSPCQRNATNTEYTIGQGQLRVNVTCWKLSCKFNHRRMVFQHERSRCKIHPLVCLCLLAFFR